MSRKISIFQNARAVRLLYHIIVFLCALAHTHCESIGMTFLVLLEECLTNTNSVDSIIKDSLSIYRMQDFRYFKVISKNCSF